MRLREAGRKTSFKFVGGVMDILCDRFRSGGTYIVHNIYLVP